MTFTDDSEAFFMNVTSKIERYYVYPTIRSGTFILFLFIPKGPLTFKNKDKCVAEFDSMILNRSDQTFLKARTGFNC
jgi:hypothetical protein